MKIKCLLFVLVIGVNATSKATSRDSIERAINRANHYFKHNKRELHAPVLMVMNYVCNYYHVKTPVHAVCLAKRQLRRKPREDEAFFKRLIKTSFYLPRAEIDSLKNTTDRLTLFALYCDRLHIPSDTLYRMMIDLSGEGNAYHISHAVLAYYLAQQHGCISARDKDYFEVGKMLKISAENLLNTALNSYDREFELYGFLRLSGLTNQIPERILEKILRTQNTDGGWPPSSRQDSSKDHTTLLAYLILVQMLHHH